MEYTLTQLIDSYKFLKEKLGKGSYGRGDLAVTITSVEGTMLCEHFYLQGNSLDVTLPVILADLRTTLVLRRKQLLREVTAIDFALDAE